jgi:glycosyltransferase involved in cell wall biosynthesis
MKIAVFDHQLNYGGGKRFLLNLLCSLSGLDKELKITLFCDCKSIQGTSFLDELAKRGIQVMPLKSLKSKSRQNTLPGRALNYVQKRVKAKVFKRDFDDDLCDEITALSKEFDVAYFPWPYLMKSPKTHCPKVATFHDFNFKYFFGTFVYNDEQLRLLNDSFTQWMTDTTPVVSTNFVKSELQYFYPQATGTQVIHLASLNLYNNSDLIPDSAFEYKHLLKEDYIVFPVHLTSHKNIGNVIAAVSIVNKERQKVKLVLTGKNTELINGKSTYYGLMNTSTEEADVCGLGYISDQQMHYLQQKAFAVINASLYEAGNGVGLDAWPMGVPVIQSSIPAFEEHKHYQGFKAFTFDPRSATSIADAITDCIENKAKREAYIQDSLEASKQLTWDVTAGKYLTIFKSLIN